MIIIAPHEMKNGKITALHIQLSPEKYEIIEISPIGFSELVNITEIISTYYDAKTEFDAVNRMMKEAEDKLSAAKDAFTKLSHTAPTPVPAPTRTTHIPPGREVMPSPPKSEITDVIIDTSPPTYLPIEEKKVIITPQPPEKEITKLPEPEKPILDQLTPLKTPQTEAKRLFDEGIHNTIRVKGKNFNDTELSLEVAKSVPQDMVAATTAELILILQANNIIKTKGKLSTFISSILKK